MTHEELQDLLNTDLTRPHPDPIWDYYQLWESLHKVKDEINEILSFIAPIENANDEIDQKIRARLVALTYSVEDLEKTCL